MDFDGIGTVANAKHPWLGYIHSPESNKSSRWSLMELVQWQMQRIHGLAIHSPELEFDGIGTVTNAKHPWLGYTQSWIQQKQPVGVWWNWYSGKCKASMAWLYTVLNPTKAAGWSLMELVQWQMQSIHGLAIYSPESNKSSRWIDGIGTVANAKHPWLGYIQSWIQQKQPVEFDGIGTVANAKHPWLGYIQSWIQQKQPVDRWNWYSSKCKASMAWLYTVLNPTKAAGGVWWIQYTWLHILFTGLYWIHQNQAKPGPNFIEPLNGKQIILLTIAEQFA